MNITFVLAYYLPELPTQNYIYQPVIDDLLTLGHHVNIICPNPTRGISQAAQKKYKRIHVEKKDNLTIYRVNAFTYHPRHFSKVKLLLRYLSVSLRLASKLKSVKSDVVFSQTNPPILLSYLISKYTKKNKIPFIYNVQDIYPDNIFKPSDLLYKLTNPFQIKTIQNATKVITISQTMKITLLRKVFDPHKIEVIYNFPICEYNSEMIEDQVASKLNMQMDKFNVVYAGNIGYVQDLDILLRAAELTKNNDYIHYYIVGEGSQAKRIKQKIKDLKLDKVFFHPAIPAEEAIHLYYLADVNIISILPHVIHTALPLKLGSCLEAKKPIIFVGLEDKIKEPWLPHEAIFRVNHRDYQQLARYIQHLSTNPITNIKYDDYDFKRKMNIIAYLEAILQYEK